MGPTLGPPGSCRPQIGPMLAPWILLSGLCFNCNWIGPIRPWIGTVYPKKYAHGFCFAVLCCGYTLTDFPISIRLTSLALWQSNDCPSASKATLMNMDKYFMWIHYERLHNHNKAKHNKTVCIFLGIFCICQDSRISGTWASLCLDLGIICHSKLCILKKDLHHYNDLIMSRMASQIYQSITIKGRQVI